MSDNAPDGEETYAFVLTELERAVLVSHGQWLGPARCSDSAAAAIGYDDAQAMYSDTERLLGLIRRGEPMTCRDWRRALVSVEVLFGSDVLGCGAEWPTVTGLSDNETLGALRALQKKLAGVVRGRP